MIEHAIFLDEASRLELLNTNACREELQQRSP